MKTIHVKRFLHLLACAAATLAHGACLPYGSEVTITGALAEQTFPEQPDYEDIAKGDAAATYFFVSPPHAICVRAGGHDDQPADERVERVQLVFEAEGAQGEYQRLRPLLGKAITCGGTLFHSISGHPHSAVLLSKAKCHAI